MQIATKNDCIMALWRYCAHMGTTEKQIGKEWQAIDLDHLSASQLLQTTASWIFKYLALSKQERREMGVGERAAIGSSVHTAVQAVLCHGQDMNESIDAAITAFDFHDADEDRVLRDKLRTCIPAMIENGVEILAEANFAGSVDEERILLWLDGVNVPLLGFVDLVQPETMFCEMKTKAPRKTKVLKSGEQGWSKASLPKKPEHNHLCQAAIYQKALNVTPSICYIAEHDCQMFTPFNCDELKADSIADALEDIRQKALIRQNLLRVSNDPKVLASITDPDWKHAFQWRMEPEFLRKAKELWNQ